MGGSPFPLASVRRHGIGEPLADCPTWAMAMTSPHADVSAVASERGRVRHGTVEDRWPAPLAQGHKGALRDRESPGTRPQRTS